MPNSSLAALHPPLWKQKSDDGTRMVLITEWKNILTPGVVCDSLLCGATTNNRLKPHFIPHVDRYYRDNSMIHIFITLNKIDYNTT